MNKLLLRFLLIFSLVYGIAAAPTAYADDKPVIYDSKTIFKIPSGDISRIFLGQFFGTVGDSGLTGSGSVMPPLFEAFNMVALGLGSVVIMFTLIVSTLNTAHEGEVLGKKWGSFWIPLRTSLGVAVLLPIQGGYSLLQAFIMWAILQGIGAADYIWNIGAEAALTTPMDASAAAIATEGLEEAGNIFRVLVCMQAINKIVDDGSINIHINPDLYGAPEEKKGKYYFNVGSTQLGNGVKEDGCGAISWKKEEDPDLAQAKLDAIRTLVGSLTVSAGSLVDFGASYVNLADLANAATSYTNIIDQNLRAKAMGDSDSTGELVSRGWMMAGAFYYHLVQQNNAFNAKYDMPDVDDNSRHVGLGSDQKLVNRYLSAADNYISVAQSNAGQDAAAGTGVTVDFKAFDSVVNVGDADADASLTHGISAIENKLNFIVGWWQSFFTESQGDPLLSIQHAGKTVVQGVEIIWIATALIAAVMGIASICAAAMPIFSIIHNFVMWFIPLFTALLTFLFLSGSLLAYYVPLIPFILFSFGALGWMFGVIEAMTAAPLIALGIVYAGGDETLGKSEPSVLLLTDLLIRPGLMIIGLLASIVMVRIGVRYVNLGFEITGQSVFSGGISYLTSVVAMICVYSSLMVAVVQKCFKLIYLVPNRVMRWIGGQADAFESGAEEEKATREGFDKASKPFAELGSEAATGKRTMKHAGGGFGASKAMQQSKGQSGQTSQSGGGGDGGGGSQAAEAAEAAAV